MTEQTKPSKPEPSVRDGDAKSDDSKQIAVRLPPRLYQKLQAEADKRSEFLAATVRRRLADSMRSTGNDLRLERLERKVDALLAKGPGASSDRDDALVAVTQAAREMEDRLAEVSRTQKILLDGIRHLIDLHNAMVTNLNRIFVSGQGR